MAARSSAKGTGGSRVTVRAGPALERSSAFDREIVAHFPWVRRVSRRLAGNVSEAEDLVQETFLRALRGAARFRSGSNFKAWLLTILRHAYLNRRRGIARAIVEIDEAKVGSFAETL